ncbi:MAG TPA: diacylglycerol kinase family protein [Myxococcales bacterium]|jgi:YegS/Rv2252/BmrU family lipid kinase
MAQLKTFLVVNPHSGNGATGRRFDEIAREVHAAIGECGRAFTERPGHAIEIARRAALDGYQCVVAVGGDGTTNEVANGLLDEKGGLVRPGVALGVIPRGTGGDFRKTFGWSASLPEAAWRLRGDAVRAIDAGRITFLDHDGVERSRYFVNIASVGISGLVDREVNRASKALGGKVSFALGSLKALWRYRDVPMRVSFDGGPPRTQPSSLVAVANGQYFGGGMWIAPKAVPDDGVFDVTQWTGVSLKDFVFDSKAIYDGSHVDLPNTKCGRAKTVRIEAEGGAEVLLDVDGEQPGRLPATVEILPLALRLKVAPAT